MDLQNVNRIRGRAANIYFIRCLKQTKNCIGVAKDLEIWPTTVLDICRIFLQYFTYYAHKFWFAFCISKSNDLKVALFLKLDRWNTFLLLIQKLNQPCSMFHWYFMCFAHYFCKKYSFSFLDKVSKSRNNRNVYNYLPKISILSAIYNLIIYFML